MMTPHQIQLVQTTFKDVAQIKDQAAALFYDRLFELDPSLKRLFRNDMQEQGRKLMAAIGVVVAGLNDLDRIVPTVRALGARHTEYGVLPQHYDTVGEALLWTLERGLGNKFTSDVSDAWATAYGTLAGVMIDAAAVKPLNDVFKGLLMNAFVMHRDASQPA